VCTNWKKQQNLHCFSSHQRIVEKVCSTFTYFIAARLDGISKPLRPAATIEDYLQLDGWEPSQQPSTPGQKRVTMSKGYNLKNINVIR
jgi:hypothetical protein